MTVIAEGSLEFTFDSTWNVLKYDDVGHFYKSAMEPKTKPTKAVDFLCFHSDSCLFMLEAKDFSLGRPPREKFNEVPMVVAQKVRDTLAGIIGGMHKASGRTEKQFFSSAYQRLKAPPLVIYLFEDLATPAIRPVQRAKNKKNVLLKELKGKLRWLTQNVAVVGLTDYKTAISDLTIRRV